jgi:hypothetical protein
MDKFEKYIKENRVSMDLHEPSPEVWEKIRQKSSARIMPWYRMNAAAAVLLIIVGIAGLLYIMSSGYGFLSSRKDNGSQMITETEIYYNNLLESLYTEAEPLLASQPGIREELGLDMAVLDSICTEIKRDLKDNVATQEVLEALIRNYAIRISLLEEMLSILKENENNGKTGETNDL